MKTRNDFVSNSSSCSFMIGESDIENAFQALFKLVGVEVPYSVDSDIRVYVNGRERDMFRLHEILHKYELGNSLFDMPKDCQSDKLSYYPEELTVCDLLTLATHVTGESRDEELLSLIKRISFHSDDYGDGLVYLQKFFRFFKRNGCMPDDSESEHDMWENDRNLFISILDGVDGSKTAET